MCNMSKVIEENIQVREVVEHCLSYFSDRLFDGGCDWPEIEMLVEDIGIEVEVLREVFNKLGYFAEA